MRKTKAFGMFIGTAWHGVLVGEMDWRYGLSQIRYLLVCGTRLAEYPVKQLKKGSKAK